ncbi:MAG: apolipoprotein A1/A4/E family protein [Deltaproteobacteria bacterium]|nr:apolipoprotein A1/A4/E family protein [Deltaproteobacteria bacterium]
MKENAQVILRMMKEFHRQIQDSLGGHDKHPLLLGNAVVRTFNTYLEQITEMFPDSLIAKIPPIEPAPSLGDAELDPEKVSILEHLHLSKTQEVAMACSQIIEYLNGALNGETDLPPARRISETRTVLDTMRQEAEQMKLTDTEADKQIVKFLIDKYNECLSVFQEMLGGEDVILPRLFKPIELSDDESSFAAKLQEMKISASGLHAYLEVVEEQEASLHERNVLWQEYKTAHQRMEESINRLEESLNGQIEDVRQQIEGMKEDLEQRVDERRDEPEVQMEERIQQVEERRNELEVQVEERYEGIDERINSLAEQREEWAGNFEVRMEERCEELSQRIDESKDEFNENIDERVNNLEEKIDERCEELEHRINELED